MPRRYAFITPSFTLSLAKCGGLWELALIRGKAIKVLFTLGRIARP